MCALHLEFAGSTVVASNVIPTYEPSHAPVCGGGGRWRDCDGLSFTVKCQADGVCLDELNPENDVKLILLDDGNIAIQPAQGSGRKYIRSKKFNYETCGSY